MLAPTELLSHVFLLLLPLLIFLFAAKKYSAKKSSISSPSPTTTAAAAATKIPKSYPLIGSSLEMVKNLNKNRFTHWTSDLLQISPSATVVLHVLFGNRIVLTADPANVKRMLKTHLHLYQRGALRDTFHEFLGDDVLSNDGEDLKVERRIISPEFSAKSLSNYVETVLVAEITDRLIPVLSGAAAAKSVLDLQDILQRFTFDNICQLALGYDPAYLSPSLPEAKFAKAFEEGIRISYERNGSIFPVLWKLKRFLNIGSENLLRIANSEVREFARVLINEKKKELKDKSSLESADFLSRQLSSGQWDEKFVADHVIGLILAGRDTTAAALTWFFWLIAQNPKVETEILKETAQTSGAPIHEEVKDLVYTQAALCESMRLYPPVAMNLKEAARDDVWDDGTVVKKGSVVMYHAYAMGRSEALWGPDWAEYRPERWLKKEDGEEKWSFVGRDAYTWPVFSAGPRVCLGREMAFLQMKIVVARVMRKFRILWAPENDSVEPVYLSFLTSKMEGGFPVLVEERTMK